MPEVSDNIQGTQKLTEFFKKNKLVLPAIAIGGGIGLFFLLKNGGRTIDNSSTFPGETPGYTDQPGSSDTPDLGSIFDQIDKTKTEYQNILDERFQAILDNQQQFQSGITDLFNQLQSGIQLGAIPGDYPQDSGYYPSTYDSYSDVPMNDTPIGMTWDEKQALIAQNNPVSGQSSVSLKYPGMLNGGTKGGNSGKNNPGITGKNGQSGGDFLTYLSAIFGSNSTEANRVYSQWKRTGVASYTDPNTREVVVFKPDNGVMNQYVYAPSNTPKTNFGSQDVSNRAGTSGPKPTPTSQKPTVQPTKPTSKMAPTMPVKPTPVKQPVKQPVKPVKPVTSKPKK